MSKSVTCLLLIALGAMLLFAAPALAQKPQPSPPTPSELEVLMSRLGDLMAELRDLQNELTQAQANAPSPAKVPDAKAFANLLGKYQSRVAAIQKRIDQLMIEIRDIERRINEIRSQTVPTSLLPAVEKVGTKVGQALEQALSAKTKTVHAMVPVPPPGWGGKPADSKQTALSDSQKIKVDEIVKTLEKAAQQEIAKAGNPKGVPVQPTKSFEKAANNALSGYIDAVFIDRKGEPSKAVEGLMAEVVESQHKKAQPMLSRIGQVSKLRAELSKGVGDLQQVASVLDSKPGKPVKVTWLDVNPKTLESKRKSGQVSSAEELEKLRRLLKKQVASLDNQSKTDMLKFEGAMQQQQQTLLLVSSLMNELHQSSKSILGKTQ